MNTKHTKIQIRSLMTLTVILGTMPSISFAGAEWTPRADMPTARVALSASVVDGKIYAIGGRPGYTGPFSTVEQYDPLTNEWTTKANMPTARGNLSTSVVDGKIYAFGGRTESSPALSQKIVEVYDPSTDTWARKSDMLIAESDHSSAAVDGKIYVIGGGTVQIYDTLTDTWTRGADRPSTPRWWAPVSVVDGKIYSIGGAGGSDPWPIISTVEEYDPATDTWTAKTDLPTPRASHATAVVDNRIYVIAGNDNRPREDLDGVHSVVEVYDPSTDTWIEGPSIKLARTLPAAAVVDGTIYLMGGFNPRVDREVSFNSVEALDLNPAVDFNVDGAVDLDDLLRLIESWGLDDPLVDIGPMPWGDGIVDSKDLLVLAEHMVEYDNHVNDLLANLAIQPFAKKPGGGGGSGGNAPIRVTFRDAAGDGVQSDGLGEYRNDKKAKSEAIMYSGGGISLTPNDLSHNDPAGNRRLFVNFGDEITLLGPDPDRLITTTDDLLSSGSFHNEVLRVGGIDFRAMPFDVPIPTAAKMALWINIVYDNGDAGILMVVFDPTYERFEQSGAGSDYVTVTRTSADTWDIEGGGVGKAAAFIETYRTGGAGGEVTFHPHPLGSIPEFKFTVTLE